MQKTVFSINSSGSSKATISFFVLFLRAQVCWLVCSADIVRYEIRSKLIVLSVALVLRRVVSNI